MGIGGIFIAGNRVCARALLFVCAPLLLASCMINSDKSYPAGSSNGSFKILPFKAGSHGALPQVTQGPGSPMVNPKVKMIYFPGEANSANLDTFVSKYAPASIWMSSVGTEYGVGQASVSAAVTLAAGPPSNNMTDDDVQNFLIGKLADVTHPIGVADGNTIYVLKFKPAVTIVLDGFSSCTEFEGYHNWFNDPGSGLTIVYAVIPECQTNGVTSLDDLTQTISHELVEAASDPYVGSNQEAWNQLSDDFIAWSATWGPELGDMCEGLADSFVPASTSNIGFGFQRMWSNAAAAAGNDPCVAGANTRFYWNSVPVLTNIVGFNDWGDGNVPAHISQVKGLKVAPGGSATVLLQLYSNRASPEWDVSLWENSTDGNSHLGTVTFNRAKGANGAQILMTVPVTSYDPGWNAVLVDIHSDHNGITKKWPFVIGQ